MATFDERFAPLDELRYRPSQSEMLAQLKRRAPRSDLPVIGPPMIDIGGDPSADRREADTWFDLAVPQSPSDFALMAVGGPLGRLGKLAALGGGFALDSDEAQAGKVKSLLDLGKQLLPIAPGETRVSSRFPTAVKSTEDPLKQHLSIGVDEMRVDPETFAHNTGLLHEYPGFGRLKGMSPDEAAAAYVDQAAGNLRYLYERSPAEMRLRSPRWYEGAHEISDALANRWGVPRQSVSAAMAALSPQRDWFMNASLGERVGDIVTSNPRATTEMADWIRAQPGLMSKPGVPEAVAEFAGKRLDQVDPKNAALFTRAFDEAHNTRNYRSVMPEGYFGDFMRNEDGTPSSIAWGTLGQIGNAVDAIRSGGNVNVISPLLGDKHKVRNFYNNIEVPFDQRFGDITADTHQVAAAQLRPLSGKAPAVAHNLASSLSVKDQPPGWRAARSSAVTGVQGTYGLVADATRQFADEAGMLPRAAQSATWEPVRELFTDVFKRDKKKAPLVDDIWKAYDRGDLSIDQARRKIFDLAGGIGTPEWARGGVDARSPALGSTYR